MGSNQHALYSGGQTANPYAQLDYDGGNNTGSGSGAQNQLQAVSGSGSAQGGIISNQMEVFEKVAWYFDVRREGDNGSSSNNSQAVYGRFIVTDFRIRFIENGKRENEQEQYYSSSIPYGAIKLVNVPVSGNMSIDIITKDQRVFRFKFSQNEQLSRSYSRIMLNCQVTKHSNLYAYEFLRGV